MAATPRDSLNELTRKVIGCAMQVSNTLGCGFLEKVYENALALELRAQDLAASQQRRVCVLYRDIAVGEYVADLVVDETLLVELKVARALDAAHEAQCLNYMKAAGLPACLLFNFSRPRLDFRRLLAP